MNNRDTVDTMASQERDLSTELVPQSDIRAHFVSSTSNFTPCASTT